MLSYGAKKTLTVNNNSILKHKNDQNLKYHLNTDNNYSYNDKKFSQEKMKSISNSKNNEIAQQILRIEKLRDNNNHFTRNQIKENLAYNSEVYPNTSFNKSDTQSPNIKKNEEQSINKINFLKINNIKRNPDSNSYSNKVKQSNEKKGKEFLILKNL